MVTAVQSLRASRKGGGQFHSRPTHPFHQHELGLSHQRCVGPRSLLPEGGNELLQPPLLHIRGDIVLQPVMRPGLLHTQSQCSPSASSLTPEPCLTPASSTALPATASHIPTAFQFVSQRNYSSASHMLMAPHIFLLHLLGRFDAGH